MKKPIIGLILIAIILITGWWFFIRTPDDSIRITTVIAPASAKLEIDGQTKSKTNLILKPNQEYTIKISREGFQTQEFKKTFVKNSDYKNDSLITAGLIPETDEAEKIAQKDNKIYMEIERLAGADSSTYLNNLTKNHPILAHLPIQQRTYEVSYEVNNSEVELMIKADKFTRMQALNDLKKLKLDFTSYKIKFYDDNYQVINPFDEYKE